MPDAPALPLEDLQLFAAVARLRSFSRAAGQLGMPVATLSRRIAVLERRLEAQLLRRTTRRVEPTDAGARLLERADEAYPAELARLIARKVVAAGVPGETSEEGLRRLPAVLEEVKPQLLILCHGGNDFLRKMDEGAAARNVREMIRIARDQGVSVMLIATPKPGFGVSRVPFYEEIGKELGIPVETEALADVLTTSKYKSDLVHPNVAGYARIAEAVADLLTRAGAVGK